MRFGNNAVFRRIEKNQDFTDYEPASMHGVAFKSILLLGIAIISALLSLIFINPKDATALTSVVFVAYILCPIVTLIMSFVISFKPITAKVLSIPYSILEGVSVGTITSILTVYVGEEAGSAVALALVITLAFFLGASILYATKIVKVTNRFRNFMFVALFGIIIASLFVSILGIFNNNIFLLFYGNGSIALIISIIMVIVASLYTFITLDNAYRLCEMQVARDYEWYAAFGIIVNFIWLFYEILRVVLIIVSRNRN